MKGKNKGSIKSTGLPYTSYINRPLARVLTNNLLWSTPNKVTLFAFLLLLIALYIAITQYNSLLILLAYGLLVLNYILDSVDGQLAREKKMSSAFGEWLDHSLDGLRLLLIHSCLGFILIIEFGNDPELRRFALIAFFLNIICHTGNYIISILKEKILSSRSGKIISQEKNKLKKGFLNIILLPADYGIFIISFLFLIKVEWFLVVYFIYGIYHLLIILSNSILTAYQNV